MNRMVFALILTMVPWFASAKTIMVLGDSISAGYGIEVGKDWVALLQQKFNQQGSGHAIRNESISGDTTAGGLARLDQALARHKPQLVLVELGANDGLRGLSPQEMKNNLAEIVRRCRAFGAEVSLLGMKIPPNYGKRFIDLFYNVYPQLADEMKVSLLPFLLDDIALKPELMQADGLHPNVIAQPLIAEKVLAFLQPRLK